MLTQTKETDLFCQYYAQWIKVYKDGAVRDVTMKKYLMTQSWVTVKENWRESAKTVGNFGYRDEE